ncbi:mechanosensitive ion channel [Persicobacter diffluens]|uniref:Uncharacterized protein n=1 Tax=Persicobacter diffluens TaxID=981 RepID=A0AAN4VWU0_9BACT|nr:hypothetical protein PEDI_10330 [Persicobacter diffluens]
MKNYLDQFIDPVLSSFGTVVPSAVGAIIVLIVGLLIAKGLKNLTSKLLSKAKLDKWINERTGSESFHLESSISKIIYYLAVVYVLLLVLDMMGVRGVLLPLQAMLNEFLIFLPRLLAAFVIGFAGYVLANIASEATGLISSSIDSLSGRLGITLNFDFTKLIKQVVFLVVFIPILIISLDSLKMKVISDPATEALSTLLNAIPNIIAAALILALFLIGGRYIAKIIESLLLNLKLDELIKKITIFQWFSDKKSISKLLGQLVFFFIAFSGIITAIEKLEFIQLAIILGDLLILSGHIFFGLMILAIGSWMASLAYKVLSKNQENAFLAAIARAGIIGLFVAISLRQMGIADEIVNLAFGLTLGAIAVAFALSFGLGGREAAGKQMEHWLSKFRKEK